ncbi:MAG: prevent-host-death protein [Deltaproteobacteria bacterium]|nr:prevent-host-death protein [Deltaproteobacteria bacterium]
MITVAKSELKAKMLEYFRKVEKTGEELIVTDNRVPVLKVIPLRRRKTPDEVFGDVRGKISYSDDLTESESSEWEET